MPGITEMEIRGEAPKVRRLTAIVPEQLYAAIHHTLIDEHITYAEWLRAAITSYVEASEMKRKEGGRKRGKDRKA